MVSHPMPQNSPESEDKSIPAGTGVAPGLPPDSQGEEVPAWLRFWRVSS